MTDYNYVVSANKPTSVTHSCYGNFMGPKVLNLIVAKCTRIEVHVLKPPVQSLSYPMLDLPIFGRIATLQLFRPPGELQDLLLIVTENYQLRVLRWDPEKDELVTRASVDVSDPIARPTDYGQICIIDPAFRLIGLHLYDGRFKVIRFDINGQCLELFDIRLRELQVLDIKFLFGCTKPTIAVLYKDKHAIHVKTYVVALDDKVFHEGQLSLSNLDNQPDLIIPVPLCGVLIIGENSILYHSDSVSKTSPTKHLITRAYGRVDADGYRYLLGDCNGLLHMLVITHEKGRVTDLKINTLGETSVASSITYLEKDVVFVGSSREDSQLIKLNCQLYTEGSLVKVIESYPNLGPILDFCVVDSKGQGQGHVVTCSGAYKGLRIFGDGIRFNSQASPVLKGIKGMWPLRAAFDDLQDTFLVIGFIKETHIFQMKGEDTLEEIEGEIDGFCSTAGTLFCHDAVNNQFVQVLSNSVRLVSASGGLRNQWYAPDGNSINIATANATQVLLATGGRQLIYLGISDGELTDVKLVQLDVDISCLDISPIGADSNNSQLAAVGMWNSTVRIYSLPDLNLITKEDLVEETNARSVLLCSFEGISYLLCALGDGHLLTFIWNKDNRKLAGLEKVSLGVQPITLRTFSSKNITFVFAASDRPTIIYSSNKKLVYTNVNLNEVSHVCPFNCARFPDRLAIASQDDLRIETVIDIQKFHIHSVPLGKHARRICHQGQTRTFAICSLEDSQSNPEDSETHSISLLDDQTFDCKDTLALDTFEWGCSIVSCSFSGKDGKDDVYYCIGTAYVKPGRKKATEGRILICNVKDGKLNRVTKAYTGGAVYSLNAFNGMLLATVNDKIELYEYGCHFYTSLSLRCTIPIQLGMVRDVKTRGNFIVVGDMMKSIFLLKWKNRGNKNYPRNNIIEEIARDFSANCPSAVEILENDIYLGAGNNFNLFTICKNSEGATDEELGSLKVVGEYHLGEFVNRFRHGSLVKRGTDSDVGQISTVIFGTMSGVIGVVASLTHDKYIFLEKLQSNMRKVIKGVGELSHQQWRSFNYDERKVDAKNFVDGDLIESFLYLDRKQMEAVSKLMDVTLEQLMESVQQLTRLH